MCSNPVERSPVCVILNLRDPTEYNQELIPGQMLEMLKIREAFNILYWSTMFLRESEILFQLELALMNIIIVTYTHVSGQWEGKVR